MRSLKALIGACVFSLLLSGVAAAQWVTVETARGTVLAQIPHATIVTYKVEQPHGHYVYAFTVREPNVTTTRTVYVDRHTGKWLTLDQLGVVNGVSRTTEHECKAGDEPGDMKCKTEHKTKVNGVTVRKTEKTEKCEAKDEGMKEKCKVKVKHDDQ
jgi:hypothetical protein